MALHTYTPTEWKNAPDYKTTPINATNLNNIETGIDNAYTDIAAIDSAVADKAEQDNLTSISETGATASQAISAGTYFYLNGTLVRAKTAIANGATFTLNTNYEVVTDGALNESVIYSTEEHIIGKWIDGSVLYEKTVDCGTLPNATNKVVAHGISNLYCVVGIEGVAVDPANSKTFKNLPFPVASGTGAISYYVDDTYVRITTSNDQRGYNGYVTIRYTKS